jgi:hypothetical protein
MGLPEFLAALMRNDAPQSGQAGKKRGNEKDIPPDDVTDCARYIRHHWDLVKQGKAPAKTKKALIIEAVGVAKFATMDRALRPSRFGWLLTLPDK